MMASSTKAMVAVHIEGLLIAVITIDSEVITIVVQI